MSKFSYQIRCRNGALVDNLLINGDAEQSARKKLEQMYPHCEVLNWHEVATEFGHSSTYEDVLDLINKQTWAFKQSFQKLAFQ